MQVYHLRSKSRKKNAPRVLFLGGSNYDLRLKRSILDTDLIRACDLATYEPRGIGRTEQPAGKWSMADYAQDALAVLDALGWSTASVVGESFGGMTALHLALAAPDRIERLVIASATAGGPVHRSFDISAFLDLPKKEAAAEALCLQDTRNKKLRKGEPEVFAQRVAERLVFEEQFRTPSVENGGYARLLDTRREHDCCAKLGCIQIPTCVIAGNYDAQARPEAQQSLSENLPNAAFHAFDAGHGVLFSVPEAMETAMGFITSDLAAIQGQKDQSQRVAGELPQDKDGSAQTGLKTATSYAVGKQT